MPATRIRLMHSTRLAKAAVAAAALEAMVVVVEEAVALCQAAQLLQMVQLRCAPITATLPTAAACAMQAGLVLTALRAFLGLLQAQHRVLLR